MASNDPMVRQAHQTAPPPAGPPVAPPPAMAPPPQGPPAGPVWTAPPPTGPPAAPVAPGAARVATAESAKRLQTFSWVMIGCGAVIALGAVLPWATAGDESASGLSVYMGWITLLAGVGLCIYARQGLASGNVQYHGWAIASIVFTVLLGLLAYAAVDDLGSLSGGAVEAGAGLTLTLLAGFGAIWPLTVLMKNGHKSGT